MERKEFIKDLKDDFEKTFSPEFCQGLIIEEAFVEDYVNIIFPSIITTSFFEIMFSKKYVFYVSVDDYKPVMRVAVPGSEPYLI